VVDWCRYRRYRRTDLIGSADADELLVHELVETDYFVEVDEYPYRG